MRHQISSITMATLLFVSVCLPVFSQEGSTTSSSVSPSSTESPLQPTIPEPQIDSSARAAALADNKKRGDDLLASYADVANTNKETIRIADEMSLRNRAASKQIVEQTNALAAALKNSWSFDPTGEFSKGFTAAAQQVLAEGDAAKAKFALEEEAIKKREAEAQDAIRKSQQMAASGDTAGAQLVLDNAQYGGALETMKRLREQRGSKNSEGNIGFSVSSNPTIRAIMVVALLSLLAVLPMARGGRLPAVFLGEVYISARLSVSKFAIMCAAIIAVLMFVVPPSNFARGSITAFAGWKPLWELGYDPDVLKNYFIAFPILLAEWGLLLLCLFAFSVIRAPASKHSIEISHDAMNAPPEAPVLATLPDVQSKADLPS